MDWKALVRSVAPTIGAALGGPMGGVAAKFLAEKFLGKPDASEAEIADFVATASPDQLAKLRQLDYEFKLAMRKLGVDVFRLEVEDRKSAREMFKTNIWPHIILSASFMVAYFVLLYGLMKGDLQIIEANREVALMLLGLLTREVPTIMQFWFGSSMGSKEKDGAFKRA